jgi:asparagine synthase (glutamine-hydrolysing)
MCGISGILASHQTQSSDIANLASKMSQILAHRGPDDSGLWLDSDKICALSHVRLSVLDLSPAGSQPMNSKCGRYTIVFNGEIYNHNDLKQKLVNQQVKKTKWRGHSDTEILLAAIQQWGLKDALKEVVGMFAFGLWDHKKKSLSLARDRFGEKPLYFGWIDNRFAFASELKAFHAFAKFENKIDERSLNLFLKYSYVPTPYSIYQDIYKLEPGSILCISSKGSQLPIDEAPIAPFCNGSIKIEKYWALEHAINDGQKNLILDEKYAIRELEKKLLESIKIQLISDVPVGTFLSGGTDSSLISALIQKINSKPIDTFSIGFNEDNYNEANYAKEIAKFIGSNHHEYYVSDKEAMDVIPNLASMYCEPFADSSQIPTYLVSNLAKPKVTVALTGDAGDELFGGYNRYAFGGKLWKNTHFLPFQLRQILGASIESISPEKLGKFLMMVPQLRNINLLGDKAHKFARGMQNSKSFDEFYYSLTMDDSFFKGTMKSNQTSSILINRLSSILELNEPENIMMAWDLVTFLTDDILCKVDRASMSVGLETRVPMLDHRLVEFAWKLPLSMKIRNGESKWILKQLLYKYIPKELMDRPKTGFSIPLESWLKGPLREWAEDLFEERKLKDHNFIDANIIKLGWKDHLSGKKDWSKSLWNVLMFLSWQEGNKKL